MATTAELPDGRVLEIHTDRIEITTLGSQPDPNWDYTDAAGHRHHRDSNGDVPTLRWVVDEPAYTVEEDGYLEEYPETGHHECPLCGEHVPPGMVVGPPFSRYVPGVTTFYLDGDEIDPDEAAALMEDLRASTQAGD